MCEVGEISSVVLSLSHHGKYFRILLDCQASPDRLDLEGETPVHIAVRNNDLETLRHLLSFKVK